MAFDLPTGMFLAAVIFFVALMVGLFLIAGIWKKITKALILFGSGYITSALASLWEFAKTLELSTLKKGLVMPVHYWDTYVKTDPWVGVPAIIIWYVICISVISDILLKGFQNKVPQLKKIKLWFPISIVFSWLPLLVLGGGLPNFRVFLWEKSSFYLNWLLIRYHNQILLIGLLLIIFGVVYMLLKSAFGEYKKEEPSEQKKQLQQEVENAVDDLLNTLPRVKSGLVQAYAAGKRTKHLNKESLESLVKNAEISFAGKHLDYKTSKEKGEIYKTKNDYMIIYKMI